MAFEAIVPVDEHDDSLETLISDLRRKIRGVELTYKESPDREAAEMRLFQYRVFLQEMLSLHLQHTTAVRVPRETTRGSGRPPKRRQ